MVDYLVLDCMLEVEDYVLSNKNTMKSIYNKAGKPKTKVFELILSKAQCVSWRVPFSKFSPAAFMSSGPKHFAIFGSTAACSFLREAQPIDLKLCSSRNCATSHCTISENIALTKVTF